MALVALRARRSERRARAQAVAAAGALAGGAGPGRAAARQRPSAGSAPRASRCSCSQVFKTPRSARCAGAALRGRGAGRLGPHAPADVRAAHAPAPTWPRSTIRAPAATRSRCARTRADASWGAPPASSPVDRWSLEEAQPSPTAATLAAIAAATGGSAHHHRPGRGVGAGTAGARHRPPAQRDAPACGNRPGRSRWWSSMLSIEWAWRRRRDCRSVRVPDVARSRAAAPTAPATRPPRPRPCEESVMRLLRAGRFTSGPRTCAPAGPSDPGRDFSRRRRRRHRPRVRRALQPDPLPRPLAGARLEVRRRRRAGALDAALGGQGTADTSARRRAFRRSAVARGRAAPEALAEPQLQNGPDAVAHGVAGRRGRGDGIRRASRRRVLRAERPPPMFPPAFAGAPPGRFRSRQQRAGLRARDPVSGPRQPARDATWRSSPARLALEPDQPAPDTPARLAGTRDQPRRTADRRARDRSRRSRRHESRGHIGSLLVPSARARHAASSAGVRDPDRRTFRGQAPAARSRAKSRRRRNRPATMPIRSAFRVGPGPPRDHRDPDLIPPRAKVNGSRCGTAPRPHSTIAASLLSDRGAAAPGEASLGSGPLPAREPGRARPGSRRTAGALSALDPARVWSGVPVGER